MVAVLHLTLQIDNSLMDIMILQRISSVSRPFVSGNNQITSRAVLPGSRSTTTEQHTCTIEAVGCKHTGQGMKSVFARPLAKRRCHTAVALPNATHSVHKAAKTKMFSGSKRRRVSYILQATVRAT